MNYFFTFLLQSVLPFAILLGCLWSNYTQIQAKRLIWLGLLCFFLGALLINQLPVKQTVLLPLNLNVFVALILFYFTTFWHNHALATAWHYVLLFIAGIYWGRDPNIEALTDTEVINTDLILHNSAVVLGLILCLGLVVWLSLLLQQSKTQQKLTALSRLLMSLIILALLIPLSGEIMLSLMKLQQLELTKPRLSFVAKVSGLTQYFNYWHSALLLLCVILFFFQVHLVRKHAVAYAPTPIEKRKKRAALLTSTRLLNWGILAVAMIMASQYYWDNIASRPPQLSQATPVKLDSQNQIHIPINQVSDGKLHRFVWIADDGKAVRFFIINRLPDRLSLAVVFDACILCGDQGYVMEGDQVVCVGCGVRMFTPSIGKPGGCNPVPIENWQQTDSQVILNKKQLEEGLNYFSTIVEIEVVDPVNQQTLTNTKTEYKYSYQGKTYFFTNEQNLNLFRDSPEHYLKSEEK
ncbi:Fe-S-containing protein [Pasteurella sp. PK-2025]|uniref:Fe-S-containing protein n=1 Tax=Pasteurella sp. PK-2025 TaxID=3413133 RepID=UPI003C71FDA2